jgi:hypothetical protein
LKPLYRNRPGDKHISYSYNTKSTEKEKFYASAPNAKSKGERKEISTDMAHRKVWTTQEPEPTIEKKKERKKERKGQF